VAGGVREDSELVVEQGESIPASMRPCSIKLAAQALFRDFMKASLLKTSDEEEPVPILEFERVEGQFPRPAAFDFPARRWPFELLLLGFPECPGLADKVISGPGDPDPPSPACWLGTMRAFLRRGWYL